jgi:hypothetical protein
MISIYFYFSLFLVATFQLLNAEARAWTNNEGKQSTAEFGGISGANVILISSDGKSYTIPLSSLSAADQALTKTLKPFTPPKAAVSTGASGKIDQLVLSGFTKANAERIKQKKAPLTNFNPLSSDSEFLRRIYLDIAGRSPNYTETKTFLNDTKPNKREILINKLLESDGYTQHMFNYIADMTRISTSINGQQYLRYDIYIEWLKQQIKENQGWDKIVFDLMTAEGKLYDNPKAGYILRDSGMRLDSLATTLTVFLGTDVSCAQCHDHPFADWTQKQFYEMAAFFGATRTKLEQKDLKSLPGGDPQKRLLEEWDTLTKAKTGNAKNANKARNIIATNRFSVIQDPQSDLRYPKHSKDIKETDVDKIVQPKFISWESANPSIENQSLNDPKQLRNSFATWMTHPKNPRFAMSMANRMWRRAFGLAVNEPVSNIDDLTQAYNPELLKHLSNELIRVNFKLKDFMRIIYNSRAYQSKATSEPLTMGDPYYFQGPLLRRMTAEQAWDSYMTLILGEPDQYKMPMKELQSRSANFEINEKLTVQTIALKIEALENYKNKMEALMAGGLDEAGSAEALAAGKDTPGGFLKFKDMVLLRSAELTQPEKAGHFLSNFGQSQRQIIDDSRLIGSIPQILTLMNGNAQQMLTRPKSLIFRNLSEFKSDSDKCDALYLNLLNRKPSSKEKNIALSLCSNETGCADLIWALINSREFIFIQ